MEKVLIIDDEQKICSSCVKILSKMDLDTSYALNGYEALKLMKTDAFAVVVTDLKMSSMGGLEVLRRVKEVSPDTMVIVITGYATVSSAVEVMKMGAVDYLPKPFTPDELRAVVRRALEKRQLRVQGKKLLESERPQETTSHQLIGESPQMQTVITMIRKVAPTDSTVLIYGESGTGKELIARAIHANSMRKDEVFFAVDCGALSSSLLESELFGHRKGAFTGAHRDKRGIFETADGGTVFLDEISNIAPEIQGKLLRFLETREFLPLGSTSPVQVNIRLVLATNRDLKEMVDAGIFREDFYYRIFVYPILVPPLRERRMDILPIAYHFLHQFQKNMGKKVQGFDEHSTRRLLAYDWPGNIRELRNVIERAVILCEQDEITQSDLALGTVGEGLAEQIPSTNEELKRVKKEIRQQCVSRVEKDFILNALIKNGWNVTRAAGNVGLQRTNFQKLMKKHGIKRPSNGRIR